MHIVHLPPFCWRVKLLPNFGVGEKEEGDLFKGGGVVIFRKKNKLKSETFNDKKIDKQKCFSLS